LFQVETRSLKRSRLNRFQQKIVSWPHSAVFGQRLGLLEEDWLWHSSCIQLLKKTFCDEDILTAIFWIGNLPTMQEAKTAFLVKLLR